MVTCVEQCIEFSEVQEKAKIINEYTLYSQYFFISRRTGRGSDVTTKPWQYLTREVILLSSGQGVDCFTGIFHQRSCHMQPWPEAGNCC